MLSELGVSNNEVEDFTNNMIADPNSLMQDLKSKLEMKK